MIWENILLAFTSLNANKMRALLTMLGIIIGIAAVISIVTVGDSLLLFIQNEMNSLGANNIMVSIQERSDDNASSAMSSFFSQPNYTDKDLITSEMINNFYNTYKDEIKAITTSDSLGSGKAKLGKEYANISVNGVSVGYFVSEEHEFIAGGLFSEKDFNEGRNVCIVSSVVTDNLFGGDLDKAVGSTIDVSIGDKFYSYTIVGVYKYEAKSMESMMSSAYEVSTDMLIPYKTSVSQTHNNKGFTNFYVVAQNGVDSDELSKKIERFFEGYYRNNKNFEVSAFNMQSMVSMVSNIISTITVAISVIAGIALIVGGIGVMNIMLVSITERTREIGTRKALGATNTDIRVQFIVEAIIICLLGGIIGIIFGISAGKLAAKILGYPASPSIPSIIISLLFSMATGVFFGYYPANKAAKMNPIDALRYE